MQRPTDYILEDQDNSVLAKTARTKVREWVDKRLLRLNPFHPMIRPQTDTPPFEGMPKIPRLSRDCIITEKIDGTNALIVIEGRNIWGHFYPSIMQAGSKKRYITLEKDNFGFAAWVQEHREELRLLGPGYHRGEWWGKGIQRGYGLDHRRFSLFNVHRWVKFIDGPDPWFDGCKKRREPPACCHVIPVLYAGLFDIIAVDTYLKSLEMMGSCAAPGYKYPEGVVVYHQAGKYLFKKTIKNDGEPKSVLREQSLKKLRQETEDESRG